jgi:hypothetical protein
MTDKKEDCEELLKELKAYRNDMVARNYPFQQLSFRKKLDPTLHVYIFG